MTSPAIRAVVTDIEGTTTSIAFVAEVLFPYARARMRDFLTEHAGETEVAAQLAAVRDTLGEPAAPLERVAKVLVQWIDEDRKVTPLKTLQGLIWRAGYENGSLRGHLYPEVAACLRAWRGRGIRLNVYSSGSEAAQKLLFGYSEAGDLTPLFDHFFDTRIGGKREPASYQQIQRTLALPGGQILFLSDVVQELDAAAAAGFRTIALDRQHLGEVFGGHHRVTDFAQIDIDGLYIR